MLDSLLFSIQSIGISVKSNLPLLFTMIAGLWVIQFLNHACGKRLNHLGIYPRHPRGLIGIVCSPFLHGDFTHLFLNSIPLLFLSGLIMVDGQSFFYNTTILIVLISGAATWLVGRPAIHIGASGLIMGYWSFLLVNAYYQDGVMAILLALLTLFYFGSMWLNLFPTGPKVSWEGHACGFVAGIITSYLIAL